MLSQIEEDEAGFRHRIRDLSAEAQQKVIAWFSRTRDGQYAKVRRLEGELRDKSAAR